MKRQRHALKSARPTASVGAVKMMSAPPKDKDGKPKRGKPCQRDFGMPPPKAQDSFTDPESRFMKRTGGGVDYSDNAQTAVMRPCASWAKLPGSQRCLSLSTCRSRPRKNVAFSYSHIDLFRGACCPIAHRIFSWGLNAVRNKQRVARPSYRVGAPQTGAGKMRSNWLSNLP